MSEHRDTSYYEVALTNRQALVAVVVLLACVVAAFLAGVWVGRPAPGEVRTAELEEGLTAPAGEVASGGEAGAAGDDGYPELDYFGEESGGAGEGSAGDAAGAAPRGDGAGRDAAPRPGSTLAEDLEGSDTSGQEASDRGETGDETGDEAPSEAGERPVRSPNDGVPRWKRRAQAAQEAEAIEQQFAERTAAAERLEREAVGEDEVEKPAAAEPAPTRPAPRAVPAPPAPAGEGVYVIQVLSSRDQKKSREVLTWLQEGGYPSSLSILEREDGVMYRVRVGPYRARSAADTAAEEIRRKFRLDTWVTVE